jgi:hypothetical protein
MIPDEVYIYALRQCNVSLPMSSPSLFWAQIAKHLPGRTDAAVKNRRNLRLSRSAPRQDSSIADARLDALTFPDELRLSNSSQGNIPSPMCRPDWLAPLAPLVSRKDKTGEKPKSGFANLLNRFSNLPKPVRPSFTKVSSFHQIRPFKFSITIRQITLNIQT